MFYQILREYGFRAHVARNIYCHALAIVRSAKSNGGDKSRIKRFSARLDHQDAKVELDRGIVKVILRDRWYTLKLKHRREHIKRFRGLRWKEVHVKYENSKLYVSIVFEFRYQPYTPRGLTAVDVNLKIITVFNGSEVRRYRTRFTEALSRRARAEELQEKYSKRWRYNKRILNRIRVLHRKARNIINDYCWKLAKEMVKKAYRHRHSIVLENLEHLRKSINGKDSTVRWKLTLFAYTKLQHSVIAKAIEYDVPIITVNPKDTSSTCPRCESRLAYVYRLAVCRTCDFKRDRDVVGAVNIWLRALQAYVAGSGCPLNASAMKDETRQSRGTRDEGMKQVIKSIQK